jgi:hypothetical protein
MHGYHPVCHFPLNSLYQLYGSNGRSYGRIEVWLEESYSSNIPLNYHCHIYNIVDRVYHALIFSMFTLFLFQVLFLIFCLEHIYAGLGLQGWIHWHYDFA